MYMYMYMYNVMYGPAADAQKLIINAASLHCKHARGHVLAGQASWVPGAYKSTYMYHNILAPASSSWHAVDNDAWALGTFEGRGAMHGITGTAAIRCGSHLDRLTRNAE